GFPVTVYNRTASKTEVLVAEGAGRVGHPSELWDKVDVLITMVADDAALHEIYRGGLLETAPAGKTVIDMSTVSPATTRELARQLGEKGVEYLDAPVSGSVKPAEMGQLVILVGGKKPVYESARPIFEKLGKISFLLGDQGAGNCAKLAINLLLAFNVQGVAEAVLFARQNGVATRDMMAIINESAIGNALIRIKTPLIENDQYPAAFALKLLAKDLRLAKEQGLQTPAGLVIEEGFREAAPEWGDQDMMAILPYLGSEIEQQEPF
ncbi:MAG TPA: NAD(P)-dependent oxidoreductase, partial [Puia sp.]|nr:NAD(P)-dependent oxidoreductase [Puia sp.]